MSHESRNDTPRSDALAAESRDGFDIQGLLNHIAKWNELAHELERELAALAARSESKALDDCPTCGTNMKEAEREAFRGGALVAMKECADIADYLDEHGSVRGQIGQAIRDAGHKYAGLEGK